MEERSAPQQEQVEKEQFIEFTASNGGAENSVDEENREGASNTLETEGTSSQGKRKSEKSDMKGEGPSIGSPVFDEKTLLEIEKLERQQEIVNLEKNLCSKLTADDQIAEIQNAENEGEVRLEGEQYSYSLEENKESSEKLIIEEGTLEEAKSSRKAFTELRKKNTHTKTSAGLPEVGVENEKKRLDENSAVFGENTGYQNAVIHTSSDIYHLAEVECKLVPVIEQLEKAFPDRSVALETAWGQIADSVTVMSSELAENLRMIIEPTLASKLEGDYRSGKRLNMKRLIAYIASDYRKDRIWLRRTKKSKRNYQVLLAVDDSLSMREYNLNMVTYQSVCMIEKALHQLEIGQLGICKFGKAVKILSDFGSHEDVSFGPRLLAELTFEQDRTDLVNLLACSKKILNESLGFGAASQMLIVVSDGRGVFASAIEKIISVLSALQNDGVVVLFVAIDNSKKSITDMKVAEFTPDGRVNLIPYLQKFPFPFYLIVRHISALPAMLAEAVRQWFELAVSGS